MYRAGAGHDCVIATRLLLGLFFFSLFSSFTILMGGGNLCRLVATDFIIRRQSEPTDDADVTSLSRLALSVLPNGMKGHTRTFKTRRVVTVLGGAIDVSPHLETRNKIPQKNKTNCRERRDLFSIFYYLSSKEKSIRLLCCSTSGIDERVERENEKGGSTCSSFSLFLFSLESTTPFAVKRPKLTIQRDSSITSLFILSFLVAVFILSPWPRREETI